MRRKIGAYQSVILSERRGYRESKEPNKQIPIYFQFFASTVTGTKSTLLQWNPPGIRRSWQSLKSKCASIPAPYWQLPQRCEASTLSPGDNISASIASPASVRIFFTPLSFQSAPDVFKPPHQPLFAALIRPFIRPESFRKSASGRSDCASCLHVRSSRVTAFSIS
jgi:hypothetical protein